MTYDSTGPELASNVLAVPIAHPEDLLRVGPIAVGLAQALGKPVEVVQFVHPDDDMAEEFSRLNAATHALAHSTGTSLGAHLIVRENVRAGVVEFCSGRWTCMATHASPFDQDHYVGSNAAALLEVTSAPVVLVGPNVPDWAESDSMGRVFVARGDDVDSDAASSTGEIIAEALGVAVSTVHIDPKGVIYEHDFDDHQIDRPDSVVAELRSGPLDQPDIVALLTEYTADGVLVMATHARRGLAWICERSVSFDTVADAVSPVVAVGPCAGSSDAAAAPAWGRRVVLTARSAAGADEELRERLAFTQRLDSASFACLPASSS